MSTSSNKRQRLAGSFSPASPPYHLAKTAEQTKPPAQPNTPTSPPYMSNIAQPNGALSSTATSSIHPPDMTPPSSTPVSQYASQPPPPAASHAFPTPASSTAGTVSFALRDADGDAHMTDESAEEVARASGDDVAAAASTEHRQSNHDRQGAAPSTGERAGLDRLKAEMGSLFKLCQNPHPISRPHSSQNLIGLYSLDKLASSVARKDPVTGEKINKLRKSYEGKVKSLQLAGKNKPVNVPDEFSVLLGYPEQEWYIQKEHGKNVSDGLSGEVMGLLDRALQMAPGKLPHDQTEKWKAIVAPDDSTKPKMTVDLSGKRSLQSAPTGRNPAAISPGLKSSRPERLGVKRRYNETSFVGYGEGYADDVADSTGGEEDGRSGSSKKKRRKDFPAGSPLGMNDRPNAAVGMVGFRR